MSASKWPLLLLAPVALGCGGSSNTDGGAGDLSIETDGGGGCVALQGPTQLYENTCQNNEGPNFCYYDVPPMGLF